VYDELKKLLVEKFEVPADAVGPERALADLGLNSLATVELSLCLESRLGLEIDDDELFSARTVGDVVGLMERCG
jgi:acyl carrier protein